MMFIESEENKMSYGIYTQEGIKKGLIHITEDENVITYIHHNITRNYKNPEEKVQAEIFCKLVLWYKYPVEKIGLYVPVTDGSTKKQADIFVYNDSNHTSPLIVIECKKEDVSEQEFAQATNQAFSYAHFTAGTIKYVWTTSGIKNAYFKFDKESSVRETVSDIPQHGVKKLSSYKYAYNGGSTASGQQLFPLAKVTESELTNIFKQAHQALWGGGELNPSEAFDELDKLIFCKIFDEKKDRDVGEPYDFQVIPVEPENNTEEAKAKAEAETNKRLLKRLTALYEEGRQIGERKNDPEIFKDNIKLNASKARTVVSYLEGVDLLSTDLDSKGRAFETFMGSFFRGDFGQYFTPRNIVSFIVDSLPITNKSKVIDTSCGSGGFLLHALYDFNIIPIKIISSIYELFFHLSDVGDDDKGTYYTPLHLVDTLLDEVYPWEGGYEPISIIDPSCGSGIFLVEVYRRIVCRWMHTKGVSQITNEQLTAILKECIYGVDLNEEAVRVASFSLSLALCDFLDPRSIWNELSFPKLVNENLIVSDFFDNDLDSRLTKYDIVIGNPPWQSQLTNKATIIF